MGHHDVSSGNQFARKPQQDCSFLKFAISGAATALEVTYKGLEGLRTEEAFHRIFASCIIRCEKLGAEAPKQPRIHNQPKRYEVGSSADHQ